MPCPAPFTDRHLFYRGIDDLRSCAECECGPPAGDECVVFAVAYTDATCGVVATALNVASYEGSGCADIASGFALGSKAAAVVLTTDGTCAATGGEPSGHPVPAGPVTLCCREDSVTG